MAYRDDEQHLFAGIKVSPLTRDVLLGRIFVAFAERGHLTITYLNPDYARRAMRDPALTEDINGFDLVLVDGNGVRWLTPLFGFRTPERLDTDSVSPQLFARLAERRGRIYLFGCGPGVAATAGDRLEAAFPGLVVAGTEHGFHDVLRGHPGWFEEADSRRIVAEVNESRADVVLVSLPTPLQQRWVNEFGSLLDTPVVMTGGSYLDHIAENSDFSATWYPAWANTLRLNWFYRLVREPRRLWRRYTIEILDFVVLSVRARLKLRASVR